jgi:ubiquinone/menaquinone biosynthesis C-methylase UbiE
MLLNRAETLLMNNPVRAAIQRHFEARRLYQMGGPITGGHALEIGCGRGVGAELILDLFRAGKVDAFDLDPTMVAIARRRLAPLGNRVSVWQGDASAIDAADGSYDACFDFGIIHHVPAWREALAEIHRVLAPGGRFYAEEVYRGLLDNRLFASVFAHPTHDRFDHRAFGEALESTGFRLLEQRQMGKSFGWYVVDKPE